MTATGTNHYGHYIDVDSFIDNHWIVEFSKQIDGYRLSNFFSKDRNAKLKMEPIWDWNLSFGNADYLGGESTAGWYYALTSPDDHIYLRRLLSGTTSAGGTTGDPEFRQRLIDRWGVLRGNVLASSNLVARVDAIAAYLGRAQAREFEKWPRLGTYVWPNPPIYANPTTYAGIISAKKSWIAGRFNWIDSQYPVPPGIQVPADPYYITPGYLLTLVGAAPTKLLTLDGSDRVWREEGFPPLPAPTAGR